MEYSGLDMATNNAGNNSSSSRPKKEARVSSRVTPRCRALIDALMSDTGVSEGNVLEMAVRDLAEKRGLDLARIDREAAATPAAPSAVEQPKARTVVQSAPAEPAPLCETEGCGRPAVSRLTKCSECVLASVRESRR